MKAKLRRLEEESTKKDRQIEQLLDPMKVMNKPQQIQQQRWAGIVDMSDNINILQKWADECECSLFHITCINDTVV